MAEKGIFRAGTDTTLPNTRAVKLLQATSAKLRDAWEKKVPLTFSTDFDYWNERMKDEKSAPWLTRGNVKSPSSIPGSRQHSAG